MSLSELLCVVLVISTHPREGTKTVGRVLHNGPYKFQLTPARGRKLEQSAGFYAGMHFNSPPRGDENRIAIVFYVRSK